MNKLKAAFLALFLALAASAPGFADEAKPEESIKVTSTKGGFELTVPVSNLTLSLPGASLVRRTDTPGYAANGPRYFYFEDKKQGLIVSGWFEPQQGFRGIQQFWKDETGAWKQRGLPEPQNVAFKKIGQWDAIAYDIELPGINNTHLRAHWLQAGTWIDLHLSLSSKLPSAEGRGKLEALLKTVQVKEKRA
ncbi:MAG TPA: hypothetical protein VIU46_01825 [Gallionellaceae bacterium]